MRTIKDCSSLTEKICDKTIDVCGVDILLMAPILSEFCRKEGFNVPPSVISKISLTVVSQLVEDEKLILKERII